MTAPKKPAPKPVHKPEPVVHKISPAETELVRAETAPAKPKASKRLAILFAGPKGYAQGGFSDYRFRGSVDECKAYFAERLADFRGDAPFGCETFGQIVDADTLELIASANYSIHAWQNQNWNDT